jgi:tRNA A-37 threonylcarbamoyl transferase component Bud32
MEVILKNILNNWDIRYDSITKVQDNVWSIDDSYILKAVGNKEWIKNLQIYKKLREHGIPAPDIVSTISGEDYILQDNLYNFLMYKMKGRHFTTEEVLNNPEKARLVGKIIAQLHKAFAAITDEFKLVDTNFVAELMGWIKNSLETNAADSFTYTIFNECVDGLDKVYSKLERHIILEICIWVIYYLMIIV